MHDTAVPYKLLADISVFYHYSSILDIYLCMLIQNANTLRTLECSKSQN